MLEQIQDVVRKNLPAEVGEQLKKHLADAETWKRERDYAREQLENAKTEILAKAAKIQDLEAKLKLAGDLDRREKEATSREIKLDVTLAQRGEFEAEKRAQGIFDLAAMAFRNPTFKRTELQSIPFPADQYGTIKTGCGSKDTTDTQE